MKHLTIVVLFLLTFLTLELSAQKPKLVVPIRHTSQIMEIAFSPDGQYFITGSLDGTARLWSRDGYELLTLDAGRITSVVFSPDSKSIVTGDQFGFIKWWDLEGNPTDTASVRRPGPRNLIQMLDYSADGKWLLATARSEAIVFDSTKAMVDRYLTERTRYPMALYPSFRGDSKSVFLPIPMELSIWNPDFENGEGDSRAVMPAFPGPGNIPFFSSAALSADHSRLITIHKDGELRWWDHEEGEIKRWSLAGGKGLRNLDFHPDGKHFVTSYRAPSMVLVWGLDGELIDSFRVDPGVFAVDFAPDGNTIFTGHADGTVYVWDRQGNKIQTFENHGERFEKVSFSPDGQYLVTGGRINRIWNLPESYSLPLKVELGDPSYRLDSVFFSPDGQFIYEAGSYDLTDVEAFRLDNENMFRTDQGDNEGGDLELKEKERDAARRKRYLKWDFTNQAVDSVGTLPEGRAYLTHRGIAVNVEGNGTATFYEGSRELATVINIDSTEWIITTPSGLFDASPRAMSLLYYVVFYKGKYEVIDLEQLKTRYYEPGLLSKVLGFSNETLRPIDSFNIVDLYPEILDPVIRNDSLFVKLSARNGGIGKLSLFINGKEVVEDINPPPATFDAKRSAIVSPYDLSKHSNFLYQHPDSTNTVSLRVYNGAGWLKSKPVELSYQLSNTKKRNRINQGRYRPKLFVVCVGTSEYTGENLDLSFADQDAIMLAQALKWTGGALFNSLGGLEVHCLTTTPLDSIKQRDSSIRYSFANKTKIRSTFDSIKMQARAEDLIVVYFSGHGVARTGTDRTQFHYLTHAIASEDDLNDPRTLKAFTISSAELTSWINNIPALKQVLIIDACNSGQAIQDIATKTRRVNSSQIRALDRMKDRTGMFIISGSAADKVSYEAGEFGQGLLTFALLKGLLGPGTRENKVNPDQPFVDVINWLQHARDEVPKLTRNFKDIQIPMLGVPRGASSFEIGMLDDQAKEHIAFGEQKPIMIRSNFFNRATYKDDLKLGKQLEKAFQRMSEQGVNADLIFVNVNEHPNAYSLGGLYDTSGDHPTISVKLFKGGEIVKELKHPTTEDVSRWVDQILMEVESEILGW